MTSPNTRLRSGLVQLLALTLAACAHGADPRTMPPVGMHALQLNGKVVNVPIGNNLFEALRAVTSASRLGELSTPETRPLYVIDDVQVLDGIRVLRGMPVCTAERVDLLRSIEAIALYGEKAGAGAIIVRSRRGVATNASC